MERYALRGTPSTLLVDAEGNLRRHLFGIHDDVLLGAEIASLLAEAEIGASSGAEAALPELAPSWRAIARRRLELGAVEDFGPRLTTPSGL